MERHGLLIFLCQQKQETSRKIDLLIETTRNIFFWFVTTNDKHWMVSQKAMVSSPDVGGWGPGGIPGGVVGGVGVTWWFIVVHHVFYWGERTNNMGFPWIEPMRIRINQHYW